MNDSEVGRQLTEALNLRHAYKRIFQRKGERISRFAIGLRAAYQRLFTRENDDAERVLKDLCKKADLARSVFTPGHPDKTAYDCGARDLVLGILRMVHSTDEDIRKQITELYKNHE